MIFNDLFNQEYRLICEKILSYLDAKSVAILGSCSKQTRYIVNQSLIWHAFCQQKGYLRFYFLFDKPNHSSVPTNKVITASPIYYIPDCETLEKLGYWREVYNRAAHLMKNWQQGIYSIAPILKGHKGKITAFDSDGFTIASGCRESRDLKIWSVEECECINTIKLKTDSINCLKLYKSDVIVAGEDGILRIYDQQEGDLKFTLTNNQASSAVIKMLIVEDTVLAVFGDNSIKAWNLLSYNMKFIIRGHTDDIECVHSYEDFLMTGSWDKTIILWDLANRGNKLATFTGHTEVVNCLRMKKDTLVSCSSDNSLRIWNLNFQDNQPSSKSLVEPIEPIVLNGHISDVNCCEIYDNYIASGGSDSLIIIWNFEGQLLFKLEGHLGCVRNLYMDDYKLVSGGDAKRIMVWDYKNGNLFNILYRNPNKLNKMIVNDTMIITESPEAGSNITIICYW